MKKARQYGGLEKTVVPEDSQATQPSPPSPIPTAPESPDDSRATILSEPKVSSDLAYDSW